MLYNFAYSLVNNFENTLGWVWALRSYPPPPFRNSHSLAMFTNSKNEAHFAYGLFMTIAIVNSNLFLPLTPRSLSANRLERIPSQAFYKVHPSEYLAL